MFVKTRTIFFSILAAVFFLTASSVISIFSAKNQTGYLSPSRIFARPLQQEVDPHVYYLPVLINNSGALPASYVLLGWNDLGMHCYNRDFQDLAVLPPYNNLWAQVIRRGDPPQIVTSNLSVSYAFPDNTYSVEKSNFWTYAQDLFNLPAPLPPNIGLTGKGMAGEMDPQSDHFIAEGIPLTEFRDSAPTTPYPYQLAELVARDTISGEELASLTVVAPVSTEMRCDICHYDGGIEGISTGRVETNILTLHDEENQDEYPIGHRNPLMNSRPVLCAECHASNALGAPGIAGIPNLSRAMHSKHSGEVADTQEGCYSCHPGPSTLCLRDVMSTDHEMTCIDCHGGLEEVASNPAPWLQEPTCADSGCHSGITQNEPLYRNSTAHGGIYCAACHDSPHAIAPSREANDAIKFFQLQNAEGPLNQCLVCHTTMPAIVDIHD